MADFTADFEAGTNGNTITDSAGEASATKFDFVIGSPTYSNTHVHSGSLAMKCASGAASYIDWIASGTEHYGRVYFWFSAYPTSTYRILNFNGVTVGQTANDGKLFITENTNYAAFTNPIATGQWIRLEWHVVADSSAGSMELKLFNNPESTSPTETQTRTGLNTGTYDQVYVGPVGDLGVDLWVDDVIANATSYPGPVPGPPALQTFKRFYGPAQLSDSAADLYTVPASTVARVMGIHASNPSGSPVDLTLSIGADGSATRVFDGYSLAADGVLDDHSPYELAAGEKIQGFASSAATVNLTITGWEKPA